MFLIARGSPDLGLPIVSSSDFADCCPSSTAELSVHVNVVEQDAIMPIVDQPVARRARCARCAHGTENVYSMITRSKDGIFKPKVFTAVDLENSELSSVHEAFQSDVWKQAMSAEYEALMKNQTWSLVPIPKDHKIVGCKWVFNIKRNSDGSISQSKARLMAKGYHQAAGFDFTETF